MLHDLKLLIFYVLVKEHAVCGYFWQKLILGSVYGVIFVLDFQHRFCWILLQDYKRDAFREAYLQCSNAIQSMEKELRTASHAPHAKIDNVLKVCLHGDYCFSFHLDVLDMFSSITLIWGPIWNHQIWNLIVMIGRQVSSSIGWNQGKQNYLRGWLHSEQWKCLIPDEKWNLANLSCIGLVGTSSF